MNCECLTSTSSSSPLRVSTRRSRRTPSRSPFECGNEEQSECLNMKSCVNSEKTISVVQENDRWKDKCSRGQNVAEIMDKIERKTLIPKDLRFLTYQGKILKERNVVKESNITTGATIEMSMRLREEG